MSALRMAQYGTTHGHAAGILSAMLADDQIQVTGVYEPDLTRRTELAIATAEPWNLIERWYETAEQLLEDRADAVAVESLNRQSLEHAAQVVQSGRHLLLDKPAGDNYAEFTRIINCARERKLVVQLGYMYRYHDGFERIAQMVRSGSLGDIYSIRAHMSTDLTDTARDKIVAHPGGILFDLGGHMIDQIVWMIGRPGRVDGYLQRNVGRRDSLADNTLAVLEYSKALAVVDIAAMEPSPAARRFEVYGTKGSAIMEPFEPAHTLRICLRSSAEVHTSVLETVQLESRPRYNRMVRAFSFAARGITPPDRDLEYELMVQDVLQRATSGSSVA